MPSLIPTQPDEPNYQITCNLDGTDYILVFRYSGRQNMFYMDILDGSENVLCGGRAIVPNCDILAPFRYNLALPQGCIIAIPNSGASDEPPGFDANGNGELGPGRRVPLYYFTRGEITNPTT